jgi:hypothetical protein
VLWVKKARWEHDVFVDQMRARSVEVLLVSDLLTETMHDPEARTWLLDRKVTANELGLTLSQELRAWLDEMDAAQLSTYLIGGLTFREMTFTRGQKQLLRSFLSRTLRTHYESKCSFCYRFRLVNLNLAADTLCLQSRINYGKRNNVSYNRYDN